MMRPHLRVFMPGTAARMVWNDGRQIDGDDGVPFLDREILDIGHVLDAGIVDQHVERAEFLFGGGDHGGDLGRLGHVGAANNAP